MIWHFVKRDLKDKQIAWILAALVTVCFPLLVRKYPETVTIFAIFYFFFGLTGLHRTIGSAFRTQHIMSRHYLLALPVKRTRIFFTFQAKAIISFLPFIFYGVLVPFLGSEVFKNFKNNENLIAYVILIPLYSFWFTNAVFQMQIWSEFIATCVSQISRFRQNIMQMVTIFSEYILAFYSLILVGKSSCNVLVPFSAVLIVASFKFFFARHSWLNQGSQVDSYLRWIELVIVGGVLALLLKLYGISKPDVWGVDSNLFAFFFIK